MSAEDRELHDQIDKLEDPDVLHRRLRHYEHGLKNGGKGDTELLSRGVSALLASQIQMRDTQVKIYEQLDQLATRTEVREMIANHATTCAEARPRPEAESIDVSKGGIKAVGTKSVTAVKWGVGLLVLLLIVLGPQLPGMIRAYKGAAEVPAPAAKAEQQQQQMSDEAVARAAARILATMQKQVGE